MTGGSKSGAQVLMRRLASVGLVRADGHRMARNNQPAVVWAVDGPDEPPKAKPGVNHIMFAAMVQAMRRGASTFEIADHSGCHFQVAQYVVREAHRLGLCHITDYTRAGVNQQPVYEWGSGVDAKRPLPMTPVEKWRRLEARKQTLFVVRALAGVA